MKKIITFVVAMSAIVCVAGSEKQAEAQVPVGMYCCDGMGYRRCILDAWYPLGSICYCYGQGNGWTCR
jgi:hypothetical protein